MLIAQISDCHVTASGTAYAQALTTEALENAVRHLNLMTPEPDIVLVTGDIADAGRKEEYEKAASILNRLKAPYLLTPGNHDHRARLRAAFPDHGYLYAEHQNAPIRYSIDAMPVRLVGLDSTRPGEHGGGLDRDDLHWLENSLQDDRPALVFMHHPPFGVGIGNMDAEPFANAHEFETILNGAPHVLRLCCGHMHRAVQRGFGGRNACIAPSTGLQLELNLTSGAPSRFMLEPGGLALHYLDERNWEPLEMVTHFGLIPGCGHSFAGPYPFFDVVSPV